MSKKGIIIVIAVLVFCIPDMLFAQEENIEYVPNLVRGEQVWEGTIHLQGKVSVPNDAKLVIKKNTKVVFHSKGGLEVFGVLQVQGKIGEEVIFDLSKEAKAQGIKFQGISLNKVDSRESYITGAIIRNAVSAIISSEASIRLTKNRIEDSITAIEFYQESVPVVESNIIINCEKGIAVRTKSSPVIRTNYFENIKFTAIDITQASKATVINNTILVAQTGISTKQGVMADIYGNKIRYADVGIYLYRVGPEEKIEANYIKNSESAIVCDSFSMPIILNNLIKGNSDGIVSVQFSSPYIKDNDIIGNGKAIVAYKKCEPIINNNNIIDNDFGIFCDYSSYPIANNNNIYDNLYSVALGKFQSAAWEKGAGSANFTKQQAAMRNSKVDFSKLPGKELNNYIDFTSNYWGEDITSEMDKKGKDANISVIFDYYDNKKVTYKGFGDQKFELDRVKYENWSKEKIKESGRKTILDYEKFNPKAVTQ